MSLLSPKLLEKKLAGKRILVDSNIIIYLLEEIKDYAELSKVLFNLVENEQAEAVVSALSIAEVMQGPVKKNMSGIAVQVKEYLLNFPNMKIQAVDEHVLEGVGRDKRIGWDVLRVVDSLILASVICNDVDLIVSNDRHFRRALPKSMLVSFDV